MKVEPSRPPKGICFSARPPTQKSILPRPVLVNPSVSLVRAVVLAQVPVLKRKSIRSLGAPVPPRTMAIAASRLPWRVVASVMVEWVP
ncbi:hypothetical protein FQZ97_864710 [compost metagenome]